MAVPLLACPLCSQPGFNTLDSLRNGLISAASRQLICPVCHDVLLGLDKFTIHLFSHCSQSSVLRCVPLSDAPNTVFDASSNENAKAHLICATEPTANQTQLDSEPFEGVRDCFVVHNDQNAVLQSAVPSTCQSDPLDPATSRETVQTETRCDRCGISFDDPEVMRMHAELVHAPTGGDAERRDFSCFLCTKVFKMRGSLMVHLRVAHGASNVARGQTGGSNTGAEAERPVVCNACGKSFTKEQHLNQHMKTHEEKQWACDVCQKLFTTKYFLKKHKRLHTGEMPYSCGICQKAFTFQQSMHKHALYHSNDKPHSCPDCQRTFKELSTLANHRRIHTGEKPFSCETCGKCFRQRVSYLVHRRIHTGVMPYQCTACGKSFRYKVSERSHKCPSQPPGVIVRQAGELLQKLQEKAAAALASVSVARQTEEPREGSAELNPASCLGLVPRRQQQQQTEEPREGSKLNPVSCLGLVPRQQQQTVNDIAVESAASQFVIVVDDNRRHPSAETPETPTDVWCRRPAKVAHPWSDSNFADSRRSADAPADFFAALEDLPSPSDGLRNLTISPAYRGDAASALQTINEESLKQLLLYQAGDAL